MQIFYWIWIVAMAFLPASVWAEEIAKLTKATTKQWLVLGLWLSVRPHRNCCAGLGDRKLRRYQTRRTEKQGIEERNLSADAER